MMGRVTVMMVMVAALLAGCGKKGALLPPEALVPAAVTDLRVEQQGERFIVSWSRPAREEGGGALKDLAGFRLFRRQLLPPGEDCEECPDAYRLLTALDLEYLQGARIFGNRFYLADGEPLAGSSYRYRLVSLKRDGTPSRTSNKAGRQKLVPPPAPLVKVLSTPSGIELTWQEPTVAGIYRIEGYNVYRRRGDESFPPVAVNEAPLKGNSLEDTRLERDVPYHYVVRTVASAGQITVESEPSGEVQGKLSVPD